MLAGDEFAAAFLGSDALLVRVATAAHGAWPEAVLGAGGTLPPLPDTPQVRDIFGNLPVLLDRQAITSNLLEDESVARALVPEEAQQVVVSPLFARADARRRHRPAYRPRAPFGDTELRLIGEISSRAALGIDNARRYAHEHRAAVALQERLLPRAVADVTAAHTVGAYAPAGGSAGVGGDWFDVIELPTLRVAFVVGDIVGHGLPAAGMGRLRTSVQNFATLELEPPRARALTSTPRPRHRPRCAVRASARCEPKDGPADLGPPGTPEMPGGGVPAARNRGGQGWARPVSSARARR